MAPWPDSAIDRDIGTTVGLIVSILYLCHAPAFLFGGMQFLSHPVVGYTGKTGIDSPYARWLFRSWGLWAVSVTAPLIAAYNDKYGRDLGPIITDGVLFATGLSMLLFAVFWATIVFGLDGGKWKATNPSRMNTILLATWIPTCIIVGVILLLSTDFGYLMPSGSKKELMVQFGWYERDNQPYDPDCAVLDPVIDHQIGKIFMIVEAVMLLVQVPLFIFVPIQFMSHPTFGYMGKTGTDSPQAMAATRGFGFFMIAVAAPMLAMVADGGASPGCYVAYGIINLLFGMYWVLAAIGKGYGADYQATEPTKMNKMLLASWIPSNLVFGVVFILSADFDCIPVDYS